MTDSLINAGSEVAELARRAVDLLGKIAGPAAEELGQMAGDWVRVRRLRNQLAILERTRKMLSDAHIEPERVRLPVLVPLLSNATLEDNADLQQRWASLLANAATPGGDVLVLPSFVDALKSMTIAEAKFLSRIYHSFADREGWQTLDPADRISEIQVGTELALLRFTVDTDEEYQAILNAEHRPAVSVMLADLDRLGIIRKLEASEPDPFRPKYGMAFDRAFLLTAYGVAFLLACERAPARQ